MLIPAEALRKAREGGWHECSGFQFTGLFAGREAIRWCSLGKELTGL
jgi:hypothetical protein